MAGRIVREGHTCKGKPEVTQHDLGTIWQCDCGRYWRLSKLGRSPAWLQMSVLDVAFAGLSSRSGQR